MRIRTILATTLLALGLAAPPSQAAAGYPSKQELGDIMYFAGDFVPVGWAPLDGSAVAVAQHPALYAFFGTRFGSTTSGGKVVTFNLPRVLDMPHGPPAAPRPVIAVDGRPQAAGSNAGGTTGLIRLMWPGPNGLPDNWVPCNFQDLPITVATRSLPSVIGSLFGRQIIGGIMKGAVKG